MLHAVCDGHGRPLAMLLTEGQRTDHHVAALLLPVLPQARELIADRGYDTNAIRAAVVRQGAEAVIPSTASRRTPIPPTAPATRSSASGAE